MAGEGGGVFCVGFLVSTAFLNHLHCPEGSSELAGSWMMSCQLPSFMELSSVINVLKALQGTWTKCWASGG